MSRPSYAAFSTSRPRFEAAGQGEISLAFFRKPFGSSVGLLTGAIVDVELAAKFQEELSLETESGETEELPESVKYFLDNGPFEVNNNGLFAIELALTGS